jgi:heme/copper-type cytochrome/quinol oxidase subunit 3
MEASAEHTPHIGPQAASAPHAPHIEAEPLEWQPRATWVGARLLCGALTFFFASFLFAYFYLRLLDTNHLWRAGKVNPSLGLGIIVAILLVASAVLLRLAASRLTDAVRLGGIALLLGLAAIVLQVIEWTTLGFGPASGGYASVFVGWTSTYVVLAIPCLYWIETQVAGFWRERREGTAQTAELHRANLEACSFFWAYYVAIGVIAFVVLYIV